MSEKLKQVMGGLNQIANKIRAYHGSPHKFDRFDMSKIGTGEGAQSYGHGLYFAENPEVAIDYRDRLSSKVSQSLEEQIAKYALKHYPDRDAAIQALKGDKIGHVLLNDKAISLIESGWSPQRGHLYAVDLHVPRERFINADEGWPYQPKEAMEVFDHYFKDEPWRQPEWALKGRRQPSGLDEYFNLAARLSNKPIGSWTPPEAKAKASNILNEAGVPGIRYLDQGSRGAGTGTRNIVMFDDAPIEIVERKADGGAVEGDGIPVPPEIAQQILGQGFADGGPVDWESYAEQAQVATNPVASPVAPQPAPAAPAPEQAIESGMSRLAPQASTPGAEIGSLERDKEMAQPRTPGTGLNLPGTIGSAVGTLLGSGMIGGAFGNLAGARMANEDLARIGAPERVGYGSSALAGALGPFAGMFGATGPQEAYTDIVTRAFAPDDYVMQVNRAEGRLFDDRGMPVGISQQSAQDQPGITFETGFSDVVDPGQGGGYGWE